MSATEQARTDLRPVTAQPERRTFDLLRREPTTREVFLCMLGLVVASTLIRAALVTLAHAPTVFSDEMGYTKLALSIGRHGRLALFDDAGLSYSPLYPAIISPIYALGASAPTAYTVIKLVNAVLVSLALIPTYKIARFALSRRLSLLVAAVASVAPLMVYPSFTMSENAAYPLCLFALWMLLEALRAPSVGKDALLVASILLATAARVQLIVLFPVALTAIVLEGLTRPRSRAEKGWLRAALGEHALLLIVVGAGIAAAAVEGAARGDVLSAFGRYANVGTAGAPNVGHFLYVLVQHIAGVDLALGVVPFVAALAVAFEFVKAGRQRGWGEYVPFAVVAVSLATWLLLEVAWDAAVFDDPHGDVPRIHERFLIYVVPFFLATPFVAYRLADGKQRAKTYLVAAVIATLLPLAIPFHVVVNPTIVVDSIGLNPFARVVHGHLAAATHAALFAVWFAGSLSLLYVRVRKRLPTVVLLILVPFIGVTIMAQTRIYDGGNFARSFLPRHTNWVDAAHPVGSVILVSGKGPLIPPLETAYGNLSIGRVYYVCSDILGSEFGEKPVTIGRGGRLRGPTGWLTANYVVGPRGLRLHGRVVATNPAGHQVLVAPAEGRVAVRRAKLACK